MAEKPRSVVEQFLSQTESTAIYGGKPGEKIQDLKDESRGEVAVLFEHEAARLYAEEKTKREKRAGRLLSPAEVASPGSNLEALMHLSLLFKDEEENETITHNQQAAALKVLRAMRYEYFNQQAISRNRPEDWSPEQKDYIGKLNRLSGELFTNLTGFKPEDYFDPQVVERVVADWQTDYETSTSQARKVIEWVFRSKYEKKEAAARAEGVTKAEEEASRRFLEIEITRFENAQGSKMRGAKPLHEQEEVLESVRRDLAKEREELYATLLTGEATLKTTTAKETAQSAAEAADEVLKNLIQKKADIPSWTRDDLIDNLGLQDIITRSFKSGGTYLDAFDNFVVSRGGMKSLAGFDSLSLFMFYIEWISHLIRLENQ